MLFRIEPVPISSTSLRDASETGRTLPRAKNSPPDCFYGSFCCRRPFESRPSNQKRVIPNTISVKFFFMIKTSYNLACFNLHPHCRRFRCLFGQLAGDLFKLINRSCHISHTNGDKILVKTFFAIFSFLLRVRPLFPIGMIFIFDQIPALFWQALFLPHLLNRHGALMEFAVCAAII